MVTRAYDFIGGVETSVTPLLSDLSASTFASSTKTSAYSLTPDDDIIFCNSSAGGFVITLPVIAGSTSGKLFTIKKISNDLNSVNISVVGSVSIDNVGSVSLIARNDAIQVYAGSTTYQVINQLFGKKDIVLFTSGSGTFANGAETNMKFTTSVEDTYSSATTGSNWSYLCRVPGVKQISACFSFGGSGFTGTGSLRCYVNGNQHERAAFTVEATSGLNMTANISFIKRLNAGDLVEFRVRNDMGASAALSTSSGSFTNIVNIVEVSR